MLKRKNRARFEKTIITQVKALLKPYPGQVCVKNTAECTDLGGESHTQLIPVLKRVFGVASISPVKVTPSRNGRNCANCGCVHGRTG